MSESLKTKTVRGLIWSGIERFFGQMITFALALVLARLVTPADYGVLAIVMVFVTVSGLVVDAGFANALVRKVDCTDTDRSTVFYSNIVVSLVLFTLLWFLSPLLASFYNNLELTSLIRAASTIFVINSLGIVQQAILTSRIDFKKQTIISLLSSVVSGGVGINLAYNGYGVWALVAQAILIAALRVIMLWLIVRWIPLVVFSKESFKDLFGYSYKLMLANLIVGGGKELVQLLLGKSLGVTALGYYNYANKVGYFLPSNVSHTIQRVLFPIFSTIQDDDSQLSENFRRSMVLIMTLIYPLMLGISVMAEPLIKILLTPEWYSSIPLLRVIAITAAVYPLLYMNINMLWVKKRSDLTLKLECIAVSLRIIIVLTLYSFGILWVCIALCIADIINFLVYAKICERVCSYGLFRQLKDTLQLLFSSLIAALVAYYSISLVEGNVLQLFVGATSLVLVNAILTYTLNKNLRKYYKIR